VGSKETKQDADIYSEPVQSLGRIKLTKPLSYTGDDFDRIFRCTPKTFIEIAPHIDNDNNGSIVFPERALCGPTERDL